MHCYIPCSVSNLIGSSVQRAIGDLPVPIIILYITFIKITLIRVLLDF